MSTKKISPFGVILVMTIIYCILSLIYCWVNGQAMMSTHLEPHYGWRFLQCAIAAIMILIFLISRRSIYWYLIPYFLIMSALLYVPIVNQYPCCSGG